MEISVVIPTRNRPDSIRRTILSIAAQTLQPKEIIVVDASDESGYLEKLKQEFPGIKLRYAISHERSVCVQRNRGIAQALSDWIFLCDDDIEIPVNHFEILTHYISANPECGVACGVCLQLEKGVWQAQYPVKNFFDLFWRYVFQLSVWSDLSEVKAPPFMTWLYKKMILFYDTRGNTLSNAGWPIITQWDGPVIESSTYALGASLVRRKWMIDSPYDEVLDPSGIGDNYGVALNFKQSTPIHILKQTSFYHHRAEENRLHQHQIYYRRALALNYFTVLKGENVVTKTRWLILSLTGSCLRFLLSGRWSMAKACTKAMVKIISKKNPYWLARQQKQG